MQPFLSKADLYLWTGRLRRFLGITMRDYPLDALSLCMEHDRVYIEQIPMKTKGLCASCIVGEHQHTVILNENRSREEKNFDVMHEMVHLYLHADRNHRVFTCSEAQSPNQDPFLEWQANEGAAELNVPFRLLFPMLMEAVPRLRSDGDMAEFCRALAKRFRVTPAVISVRFESLRYEIQQYFDGVPLEGIRFLSRVQQEAQGIDAPLFSDLKQGLLSNGEYILNALGKQDKVLSSMDDPAFRKQEEQNLYGFL